MSRPQFSLKTLLWLMAVAAAFCGGTQLDRYLAERRADPSEITILAALDEKTDLDFTELPLTDVIDYLKQRHGIEIQLDHKALTDAGVGTDTPVTRQIKGITLRSALKLLLSEFDLTYVVQNGVLMVTSTTKARSTLYPWLNLNTALWLAVFVAAFLGGIECNRAWRRRADNSA